MATSTTNRAETTIGTETTAPARQSLFADYAILFKPLITARAF